jgi:glucokinase
LFLPNLPTNWRGIPLGARLCKRTGRPVRVANDARVATLGEFTFGNGRRSDNLALVTLGTGIGGGLVLNGQLLLGRYGAAGELGHQTIVPDGDVCGCGNRGCLETVASGPALVAAATKALRRGRAPILKSVVAENGGVLTPREMMLAVSRGDAATAEIIETAAGYLGIGVANVVTITGVERVVLTGGLTALGKLLLDPVRLAVHERIGMFPTTRITVELSKLADRAGTLGAIAMAAGIHDAFIMKAAK